MRGGRRVNGALEGLFDLSGRVAVVTGATGTLDGEMARGLARAGARVGILGRREKRAAEVVAEIENEGGGAVTLVADVLDRERLEATRGVVIHRWGRLDVLVNTAGGNVPEATVSGNKDIFGLPEDVMRCVFDLNLLGKVLPSQSSARRWHGVPIAKDAWSTSLRWPRRSP
jgi:NAD(P)-dependent dehydrogenase (short-subunit alcohol dehydrogenase family)